MPSRNATWQLNIHQNRGLNRKNISHSFSARCDYRNRKFHPTEMETNLWRLCQVRPETALVSGVNPWFSQNSFHDQMIHSQNPDSIHFIQIFRFLQIFQVQREDFHDHPNNSKQRLANLLGSGVQNRLFGLFASASRKRSANAEVNSPGKMENGWPLFPCVAHKSSKNAGCWVAGSARVVITQDSWKKKTLNISSEHCRGISKIPCGNSLTILKR